MNPIGARRESTLRAYLRLNGLMRIPLMHWIIGRPCCLSGLIQAISSRTRCRAGDFMVKNQANLVFTGNNFGEPNDAKTSKQIHTLTLTLTLMRF